MLKTAIPAVLILTGLMLSVVVAAQGDWAQAPGCPQEGIKRSCGSNVGECVKGERECVMGDHGLMWSDDCIGGVEPIDEIPGNGLDDDCNGLVDEGGFSLFSLVLMGTGVVFMVIAVILSRMG